jgi:cytochrome c
MNFLHPIAPPIWRIPMSRIRSIVVAVSLGLIAGAASANADMAKAKNCTACHAVDKKLIGPSFKDIAAKYAADKDAVAKLSKKVREGGTGVWGQVPMPANPQVSADEATTLVKWVMTAK